MWPTYLSTFISRKPWAKNVESAITESRQSRKPEISFRYTLRICFDYKMTCYLSKCVFAKKNMWSWHQAGEKQKCELNQWLLFGICAASKFQSYTTKNLYRVYKNMVMIIASWTHTYDLLKKFQINFVKYTDWHAKCLLPLAAWTEFFMTQAFLVRRNIKWKFNQWLSFVVWPVLPLQFTVPALLPYPPLRIGMTFLKKITLSKEIYSIPICFYIHVKHKVLYQDHH